MKVAMKNGWITPNFLLLPGEGRPWGFSKLTTMTQRADGRSALRPYRSSGNCHYCYFFFSLTATANCYFFFPPEGLASMIKSA